VTKNDPSKLARVYCPWDGPDESPTARSFVTRPPTGTPRRAISPGEGLLIFPTSPSGKRPDRPSLRASDEHSFIVRVLRARRMVWLFPSHPSEAARCASTGDSPGHPSPAGGLFQHPAGTGPSPLLFLRLGQDRLEDGICVQHRLQRLCPDEELPDVRSLPGNFSEPSFGFRQ